MGLLKKCKKKPKPKPKKKRKCLITKMKPGTKFFDYYYNKKLKKNVALSPKLNVFPMMR